jgi:hypothetical protein
MKRRFSAALVLLLVLPLVPAAAEPVDPTPPFIVELQTAICNDDKTWLADRLHLPVTYFGKTKQVIRSKAWFLKHYATVMGLSSRPTCSSKIHDDFKNYQGVMVGDGGHNIWLDNYGDEGAGIPTRFEIITIDNSD